MDREARSTMGNRKVTIDLVKLAVYILKRCWLVILCGAIGFGFMYWRSSKAVDAYTAAGTMYVYNVNPNLVNYGYTNVSDLNSAVQLVDTYAQVVKSNRVLDAIAERMAPDYPGISSEFISSSLAMASVAETGVVRVSCRTMDGKLSADIVNTVLDVAPNEIKRVVGAGDIEIIDYASAPEFPDAKSVLRWSVIGAVAGMVFACALLLLLFLLNQRVNDPKELTDNYTLPILSSVKRRKGEEKDPGKFVLTDQSDMDLVESYAKLRMNLLYTLVGKKRKSVLVTSSVSGEGKSTITANLAISLTMAGKRMLLIDADMRRACQHDIFHYPSESSGLSDVLIGTVPWREAILSRSVSSLEGNKSETAKKNTSKLTLDILPAGTVPPNPSELLESPAMQKLLEKLEAEYDLILLDVPPINIVSDPLALSSQAAGGIFVVRQDFTDHREIRKALISAEMTGLELLGFVFYGEKLKQGSYYSRRHYKKYYNGYNHYDKYDPRNRAQGTASTQNSPQKK